ncbi:MAG: DUF6100 family protein, partial [Oscillospiraceae bacterium]
MVCINDRLHKGRQRYIQLVGVLYAEAHGYPDNYEVLSTDAALRAEKIACRLRHLIYS